MKPFICSRDKEITPELLGRYMGLHRRELGRYRLLGRYYEGFFDILKAPKKPGHKPDNRVPVNYAKYIVDTLNGYFMGKPPKVSHKDPDVLRVMNDWMNRQDEDDNNAEISKMCSTYGRAYKYLYQDEEAQPCATYFSPMEGFVVYDDTVAQRPYFGVHFLRDEEERTLRGTVCTEDAIIPFWTGGTGGFGPFAFGQARPHYYEDVPIVEFIENEERRSAYEPVLELIDAYTKAFSEKANDVEYFADAYMKVIGARLEPEQLEGLRDKRIINLYPPEASGLLDGGAPGIDIGFMEKPNADTTQENFLNRAERLIFSISMVANINDEDFGNASSLSLAYKLNSMENLALAKERKFESSLRRVFRMVLTVLGKSSKISAAQAAQWPDIEFEFFRNIPRNTLDEAEIAAKLKGLVSDETLLTVLSFVPDVGAEMERIRREAREGGGDMYAQLAALEAQTAGGTGAFAPDMPGGEG